MYFDFSYKPYIAVIGDIKGSRELQSRKEVQKDLQHTLKELNGEFAEDIASNFMITLGDEFQGLLNRGRNVLQMITEIDRSLYPIKIRFGIGIGAIVTEINRDMAIGADGPGYYKAREAIEFLRQNEKKKQKDAADIRIELAGEKQESTVMINTVLTLLSVIKDSWSDRQREIIQYMLLHQESQANVAGNFHITQPTVQRTLAKGSYYAYKEAFDTVTAALGEVGQDGF